jgi:hypothetical protein
MRSEKDDGRKPGQCKVAAIWRRCTVVARRLRPCTGPSLAMNVGNVRGVGEGVIYRVQLDLNGAGKASELEARKRLE